MTEPVKDSTTCISVQRCRLCFDNRFRKGKEDSMAKLVIDFDRCKECGYCIKFCPKNVLAKGDKVNKKGYYPPVIGEGCIACGTCSRVCPDTAISVYKED